MINIKWFIKTIKKGIDKDKNANETKCKKMLEKLFTQVIKADRNNAKKAVESLIDIGWQIQIIL